MFDFFIISTRSPKNGVIEIYPKFIMKRSKDLMIRGGDFYAIWVEERGLWSTDEQDAIMLIDREVDRYANENKDKYSPDTRVHVLHMWDAGSGMIDSWHKYCQKQLRDSFHMLDEKLIFANTPTNKEDYASKKLSYALEKGECPAYDKLIGTLYSPEEREKIEWAIGSIITGDSKTLQKFVVLYGAAGTGKSTVLNIIQQLFDGYYAAFSAKALGSSSDAFALEAFKTNPLVAIEHDGDLSRIEDNTRLNSLVSHELMTVNEKFKSAYSNRFKSFLFMGTNKPVRITDAKSGLIRRLIDVTPSGNKVSPSEYDVLVKQIGFELGAIAYHCQEVYLDDKGKYDNYIPETMLSASNDFYNFVLDSYYIFKKEDGVSLKAAWEMYKTYCDDAKVAYPYSKRMFQEELKNYFWDYDVRLSRRDDGSRPRNYYSGFRVDRFESKKSSRKEVAVNYIQFTCTVSVFDKEYADCPAQYATERDGQLVPYKAWDNVTTKLSDLDTSKVHYVKVPENHIVIDFDIPDENGNKSFEKNLEAASKWPATYAELSKSGAGIHLHYIYTGDVSKIDRIYSEYIEVKVFIGKMTLRRKLTKCNDLPIATISSGLPLRGDKDVVDFNTVKNESMLRSMIRKAINKEYHSNTSENVNYIKKLLNDAYEAGITYDLSDLYTPVLSFAMNSTNQKEANMRKVSEMHFKSSVMPDSEPDENGEKPIIIFDVEVMRNLFVICWKKLGEDNPVVKMINPEPREVQELMTYRLIGFNCRRYDNHILYARAYRYYDNEQLYALSQNIIKSKKGDQKAFFGNAYNVSYTDIFDFSSEKKSLKKFEIALGIHHQELAWPWDQPVPEEMWDTVAEYCANDVIATEAVFMSKDRQADWTARQILADLAGMTVNDTTNSLTTRIIFGENKNPQLVYTDLSEIFPGYEFKEMPDGRRHNMYRGVDVGRGGYIRSNPGMYGNVALLDVESMHPNSIINMNCFGEYTQKFKELLDARICIKHGEYEKARNLFGGKLAKYLDDPKQASSLAKALKIAINSVYGLTSASFSNPFRDPRNENNIVALRGALFMKTLQDEVEKRGYTIVAIKTDSIKIADASMDIVQYCLDFAHQYGYNFEHEATYERMCQINDADYIARYADLDCLKKWYPADYADAEETFEKNKKFPGQWTVTGKQFAVPYVFKKLFSHERVVFDDLCETKEVKTALYLDMNEGLPDVSEYEKELSKIQTKYKKGQVSDTTFEATCADLEPKIAEGHDYHFIGKIGLFCPIKPGRGGGMLMREDNGRYYAATGTTGYRWKESEMVKELDQDNDIDMAYFNKLANDMVDAISKHGDFEWFVSDDPYIGPSFEMGEFMNRPIYDELPFN